MDSDYDLVVIGAGPGGYVAAIRAGQLGMKTAIVEREALGGVCLNWGCIPSKSLLRNAEIVSYFPPGRGILASNSTILKRTTRWPWNAAGKWWTATPGVSEFLLRKNKVDHFEGTGVLKRHGVVEVSPEGRELNAKNIVIATGARPRSIPPLFIDGEKVITSRESIVQTSLPSSIAIVGGGPIGVEFAYIYKMYGVDVTVVELLPRLIPNEDEEVSPLLERAFSRMEINVMTGAGVTGVDISGAGAKLSVEKDGAKQSLEVDQVLVAIGVQANTEDLGLEGLGIEIQHGLIEVDDVMATNIPGVYAIGDVTGKLALAHVATAQAVTAVEHMAGLETQPLDYTFMPRATYCQPQIASFGLTEAQAREQGYQVSIGSFNVQANGKALAMGETEGIVKLVVDQKYGELLGGHMIGPEVTELLGELTMTKMLEGTTLELGWAVHAHPSLSEMVKEAALSAQGRAIHS